MSPSPPVPSAPSANYGPALLLLALTNLDQAIFGSNDIFWLGGRCNFSWLIAETLTGWHTFIVHRTLLTKELCILARDIEMVVYVLSYPDYLLVKFYNKQDFCKKFLKSSNLDGSPGGTWKKSPWNVMLMPGFFTSYLYQYFYGLSKFCFILK